MKIKENSLKWVVSTYKFWKVDEKVSVSIRIDKYGNILLYSSEVDHWILNFILKLIYSTV